MGKPILCLDFDGVIHSYSSGWKGADVIPDPPVAGAIEFIIEAVGHFDVHIYSSRSNQEGGISAMKSWLWKGLDGYVVKNDKDHLFNKIKWPVVKPPAMVTIDDRALTFTGEWPSFETLMDFKPWNKKDQGMSEFSKLEHTALWNDLPQIDRERLMPYQIENHILHLEQMRLTIKRNHKRLIDEINEHIKNLKSGL